MTFSSCFSHSLLPLSTGYLSVSFDQGHITSGCFLACYGLGTKILHFFSYEATQYSRPKGEIIRMCQPASKWLQQERGTGWELRYQACIVTELPGVYQSIGVVAVEKSSRYRSDLGVDPGMNMRRTHSYPMRCAVHPVLQAVYSQLGMSRAGNQVDCSCLPLKITKH